MTRRERVREELYAMVFHWQEEERFSGHDPTSYRNLLDEVFFHADAHFQDYSPYPEEGEFPVRLKKWLSNVSTKRDKKTLLKLLLHLLYVDRLHMSSLSRDAFRRVITPWILGNNYNRDILLTADYEVKLRSLLRRYPFYSITESLNFSDFLSTNSLSGIPRPSILGEKPERVANQLPRIDSPIDGLIILEDFVGSGKQAKRVLKEVQQHCAQQWRLLFIPLIILEVGLRALNNTSNGNSIDIRPVLVIPNSEGVQRNPKVGESLDFLEIRALVESTGDRVIQPMYHELDDPPNDAFGYGGCGSIVATYHNTPNNTLPLIHHRAPNWQPLFRRLHHSKDGLK